VEHIEPNQFDSLLSSGKSNLVMFYVDWCPFCQTFKPIFESPITTKPASNGYKFYESKVNDDDNHYGIDSQLVLVLFLLIFGLLNISI
jgi:thioredoxin 1